MKDSEKEKFCSRPFEHFEITSCGEVFLCCPAWLPIPVGSLKKDSVMEAWNSEVAAGIRKSILGGNYHFCRKNLCSPLQRNALPGRHEIADQYLREIIEGKVTILPNGPKKLVLGYDPTCNLFCPSCRTARFILTGDDFSIASMFQDKLRQGLEDAELLVVAGNGEPFASRLYMELLTKIDPRKHPSLKVQLKTNAILFTPKNWDKLRDIQSAARSVHISIDAATPETYRVLRRGGEFSLLLDNLHFISNLRKDRKITNMEFYFVVQQGNYKEMKEFVKLGMKFGADLVVFNRINNWGTFTSKEFLARAVHYGEHPEHQQFLNIIDDPIFKEPVVNMGNISEFLSHERQPAKLISRQGG